MKVHATVYEYEATHEPSGVECAVCGQRFYGSGAIVAIFREGAYQLEGDTCTKCAHDPLVADKVLARLVCQKPVLS